MGGNLMQMLQQYGGGGIRPTREQSPLAPSGGNFDGALGLANGGGMALTPQGGVLGGGGNDGSGGMLGGGATSPFEVGGNSGGGGGDPNDPSSYQYMMRHPPMFSQDYGPNSAHDAQQAAWQKKLEEARLRASGGPVSAGNGYGAGQLPGGIGWMPPGQGAGGGGGIGAGQIDLQDLARRFAQSDPHYGDLSWGERMRGREGDPRDMGNGQMAGGAPPWMQRRNPGTRDGMRRGYWDRGMNDQGGQQQMPRRPMGGYWQRPMGGPMPGQGVPLGGGGREMPMPAQAPPQGMPVTQGGMIKSAAPQQQQSYQPAAPAPAQAPSQPVRRATRDDNNARGWSGYA